MKPRVLVVDDEDGIRGLVRIVLEGAGYDVDTASNGLDGLHAIEAEEPDLVVLDIMMPVMDGWQVLAAVAARPRQPAVVVLSATPDPGRAVALGAAACVPKPFDVAQLIGTCRRVLGSSACRAVAG